MSSGLWGMQGESKFPVFFVSDINEVNEEAHRVQDLLA